MLPQNDESRMIAELSPPWVASDLSSIVRRSLRRRGAHLGPSGETQGHPGEQEPQYMLANAEAADQQGFEDAVLGQGYVVVNGVSVLSVDIRNVWLGYHQPPSPSESVGLGKNLEYHRYSPEERLCLETIRNVGYGLRRIPLARGWVNTFCALGKSLTMLP
jgi:hypothetical protein